MKNHPAADIFPMMSDEELQDLVADIKAHGLIHPIIIDDQDLVIDGRNRLAACKLAKVDPTFEKLNGGHDALAYIVSANLARRNLTKGQQAMAYAMIYPDAEKRGRGNKAKSAATAEFSGRRLRDARTVLRHSHKLAEAVIKGTISLDEALETVKEEERRLESSEVQIARLRTIAPDLADQVDEQRLKLAEALAAYDARKKERDNAERAATGQLAQLIILLNPGKAKPAEIAQEWFDDINPKFWNVPTIELSKKTVAACAEVLNTFAELWAKRKTEKGD